MGESQLVGGEAYDPLRPPPKPRPVSTLQRPPPHPKQIKSAGTSRIKHQIQSASHKLSASEMDRMETSDGTGTDNEQPQQQRSTSTTANKHTKHRKKHGTKVSKKNGSNNADSGTDNNSDMDEIEAFIGIDNTAEGDDEFDDDDDDDDDAMTEPDEISLLDSQVQFHHHLMDYEPMADADQEAVFDAMKATHSINILYLTISPTDTLTPPSTHHITPPLSSPLTFL